MQLTFTARIQNRQWRHDAETGFLRVTATILRLGVLQYRRSDLPEAPAGLGDSFGILVTPEALADPAALTSLEGVPATAPHHVWQTAGTINEARGNVAGAPIVRDGHLWADILITDPVTVHRVMLPPTDPDHLSEISSAYDSNVTWEPGTADGQVYGGVFHNIRYNHVAILPPAAGRAGPSVRIVNKSEPTKMADELIRIKLASGHTIRVHNEDVKALEESETQNAAKVDPAKLQEVLAKLAELNGQIDALTKERDTLTGQVKAFKDELDAALSPANVEAAAATMNTEREEAMQVANSLGVTLTDEQRKLHGHGLRVSVVNSVNAARGLKPVDEKATPEEVIGLYGGLKYVASIQAKPPTGHQVMNSNPVTQPSDKKGPDLSTNEGRKAQLYGSQK